MKMTQRKMKMRKGKLDSNENRGEEMKKVMTDLKKYKTKEK